MTSRKLRSFCKLLVENFWHKITTNAVNKELSFSQDIYIYISLLTFQHHDATLFLVSMYSTAIFITYGPCIMYGCPTVSLLSNSSYLSCSQTCQWVLESYQYVDEHRWNLLSVPKFQVIISAIINDHRMLWNQISNPRKGHHADPHYCALISI